MPQEQRRVGFALPAEVFAQLCEETLEGAGAETFWEHLRSYYQLSPMQGDSVICDPSFLEQCIHTFGDYPPPWVYTQPLQKMQCVIIAGARRGEALLTTLREIDRLRDQEDDTGLAPTP